MSVEAEARRTLFLDTYQRESAISLAAHDAFPEVIRILMLFRECRADLTLEEAATLLDFARYLVARAHLMYPYRDGASTPFLEQHEEMFHWVMMGLYEKLTSELYPVFPELFKD